MLCQNCNQNEVTAKVREVVNGNEKELLLCEDCARKLGYLGAFSPMFESFFTGFPAFNLQSLFGLSSGEPFAPTARAVPAKRCEGCQSSLEDIMRSGRVGCAKCYDLFQTELEGAIRRMQPGLSHTGSRPALSPPPDEKAPPEPSLSRLKARLEQAIREEKFEEAAKLRDEIRDLGGK